MTAPADTARTDQYRAAVTDAASRAHHAATAHDVTPVTSCDPWLMAQISQLLGDIQDGNVLTCLHLADAAPRVLHSVLWAPGMVVCSACTWLLTPDDVEDTTCDRCRQPTDPIRPHLATVGPILLGFGLCRTCTDLTQPHGPKDAQ
jgi:hypothetical protein